MSPGTLTELGTSAEVAVPIPVAGCYSYALPPELESRARIGCRVLVSFKNREMTGYLVALKPREEGLKLKPLLAVLDDEPVLSPGMLELTRKVSDYYGSGWGEAIENALPRWVKFGKKAAKFLARSAAPTEERREAKDPWELTRDQQGALEVITGSLSSKSPKPVLLYGVTGCGKSEIYIRAIREVLNRNRSAICLVPEIALTEQLKRFFSDRFGGRLEILHSKMSDGERFLAWKRIQGGDRQVVLGPRSAVFAPVRDLGIIVIDEEHEGSYKQETSPRYHAREVARWRAGLEGALLVMGTATPSLESMYLADTGEIRRLELPARIDDKKMPAVQLIDLKASENRSEKSLLLSRHLVREIGKNLAAKEGTMILLNRRGFSTYVHCPRCGNVETCKSCNVSLTYHQDQSKLLCHYCNFEKPAAGECGECKSPMLRFTGFGTEKVESEIARIFPAARIARMDMDSVRRKGSHEKILAGFRDEKTDILVGTQMIAKGFDFPHVTLVGVVLADVGLMLPDFRSAERTFQLLTQVAGRAGRGMKPGRVLVQTYSPDHPSVLFAQKHDYTSFYRKEVSERLEHKYPPAYSLVNFIVRSRTEKKAYLTARALRDLLKVALETSPESAGAEIIGPAQLPFYRLRGHFRWHVMIKAPAGHPFLQGTQRYLDKLKKPSGVAAIVDVDPVNIL